MTSTAKLGIYIEKLNRPNSDLVYGIDDVCGITNTKQITIGTKANLIGRTFEKFTVLEPREFIFNRRTSRNGERISLGFNETDRNWILTEDYCHFRIKNEKEQELLPEYLYLFFLNPEFDRYARFNSWGSATEFFNWEEMIEVPICVPSIENQRRIVHDYRVIVERIELLNQINTISEKIIDSIYHLYVSRDDVFTAKIKDIGAFVRGKNITSEQMIDGEYDVISAGLSPSGVHNEWNASAPVITVSGSGVNAGYFDIHYENIWAADCSYNNNSKHIIFLLESLKSVKNKIELLRDGHSAQPHVYPKDFNEFEIKSLPEEVLNEFDKDVQPISTLISLNRKEIKKLLKLKFSIISKL